MVVEARKEAALAGSADVNVNGATCIARTGNLSGVAERHPPRPITCNPT